MNKINLLLSILIIGLAFPILWKMMSSHFYLQENFSNLGSSPFNSNTFMKKENEKYPFSSSDILLKDSYPLTGRKCIGNNSAYQIWWHYPTFQEGSYDQITNNIRYNNNPDIGNCMPADFCGSLYKEYQTKGNYVYPLPPVKQEDCGTRVNYYYTEPNMLPYRASTANILY
jgi:hypothetical protein